MKKNVIALSFIVFIIICGIFYGLTELLSRYKAADLENTVTEKVKIAARTALPSINKSIENSDDIGLLINIETLAKTENINSCFILDRDNKVIIHNNTDEWNKERKGENYDRAVNYNGELLQITPDPDHLLFSAPLAKDYTLFCIISTQNASQTARYWKIKYFTVAGAAAVIITLLLYMFTKLLILFPFNRTKKALEQSSAENIKQGKYDEITDIFLKENEKAGQLLKSLEADKESLSKIIEHYAGGSAAELSLFMILDCVNNIIYSSDKTGKILKPEFSKGANILEAASNAGILKIVEKANEEPQTEIEAELSGLNIKAVSIGEKNKLYGTIIKAE